MHYLLESLEGRQFHGMDKRGINELSCAVSLDFGSSTRRGLPEEYVQARVARESLRTERVGGARVIGGGGNV